MIFVTVGTQLNNFDRLFKYIDRLDIKEKIVVQRGNSRYIFKNKNIISQSFFSYDEMEKLMKESDIIITHAGPGTIFKALELNKKLIVVPRLKRYHEIVAKDHQHEFCKYLKKMNYCMIARNFKEFKKSINTIGDKSFKIYKNDVTTFENNIKKEIDILLED